MCSQDERWNILQETSKVCCNKKKKKKAENKSEIQKYLESNQKRNDYSGFKKGMHERENAEQHY